MYPNIVYLGAINVDNINLQRKFDNFLSYRYKCIIDIGVAGKWRHCAAKNVGVSEETLALTSDLVGRKVLFTDLQYLL